MRDDVRDAYQLTIEIMAKCIGDQKEMIEALQKDTVALQRMADIRVKEACTRHSEDSRVLNNEIRQLKESIHSLQNIPRNSKTIIDDLALSARSHRVYSQSLESGIRKTLSKEVADRLIEEAHRR